MAEMCCGQRGPWEVCCGPDLQGLALGKRPMRQTGGALGLKGVGLESLPHHLLPIQPFCRLTNFLVPQFPH